jgi:hypothetical protein
MRWNVNLPASPVDPFLTEMLYLLQPEPEAAGDQDYGASDETGVLILYL